MKLDVSPIGIIHSPYKEKFAIPRQPGLVTAATATLELLPPYNQPETVRGIEQFSHLWLIFAFHQTMEGGWRPTVRPPRLGGNERLGVFATRSTFRPNPFGLSVVKLVEVQQTGDALTLKLAGIDLVDGTPIIDIKPYIPYADSLPDAQAGYAEDEPASEMSVSFTPEVLEQIRQYPQYPELQSLISQVLAQDPRPAYKKNKPGVQEYGVHLLDFNVCWEVEGNHTLVTQLISR